VVSTVDNIIKPLVLHGQSKLHPLLALLSVLWGVGALGPIGIFVGPIAVAFLQAALTMLQAEIGRLSGEEGPGWDRLTAARRNDPPTGLA
jgi:predicted PurR-regulated permease PerM